MKMCILGDINPFLEKQISRPFYWEKKRVKWDGNERLSGRFILLNNIYIVSNKNRQNSPVMCMFTDGLTNKRV